MSRGKGNRASDARALELQRAFGNGRAAAGYLAGQFFWGNDDVTPPVVNDALAELDRVGLVRLYEVSGQKYVAITNWRKHQRIDNAGKPRVPGPELAAFEPADPPEPTPPTPSPETPDPGPQNSPAETRGESPRAPEGRGEMRLDQDPDPEGEGDQDQEEDSSDQLVLTHPHPPDPQPDVVAEIPCTGRGAKTVAITEGDIAEWSQDFPGVDVRAEVLKARRWAIENPRRRKTAKRIRSWICTTWLSRAQDTRSSLRVVPGGAGPPRATGDTAQDREARIRARADEWRQRGLLEEDRPHG